jgi:hypothetical protein
MSPLQKNLKNHKKKSLKILKNLQKTLKKLKKLKRPKYGLKLQHGTPLKKKVTEILKN